MNSTAQTHENTLQTFDFNENPVRAIQRDGNPWFVAADVCRVLEIQNTSEAIHGRKGRENALCLDDDERGIASVYTPSGDQQMLVINESGLYALIFKSRKPQALAFRKWVTGVVLPAIRKTGQFFAGEKEGGSDTSDTPTLDFERFPICRDFFEVFSWLRGNDIHPDSSCNAALRLVLSNLKLRHRSVAKPSPFIANPIQESGRGDVSRLVQVMSASLGVAKSYEKFTFSEISHICEEYNIFNDILEWKKGELSASSRSSLGLALSRHFGIYDLPNGSTVAFGMDGVGKRRFYHVSRQEAAQE